jgi:hypothetical protein
MKRRKQTQNTNDFLIVASNFSSSCAHYAIFDWCLCRAAFGASDKEWENVIVNFHKRV